MQNLFVITGASGAGKSSLVEALARQGHATFEEAALAVVREQKEHLGKIIPLADRPAFIEAVLERNIANHRNAQSAKEPVFFDRGIPECLAWLELSGIAPEPRHSEATVHHRYAQTIFVAEPWAAIYVRDAERKASFERAARSFQPTVDAYVRAGYKLCTIPKVSLEDRVQFILEKVAALRNDAT